MPEETWTDRDIRRWAIEQSIKISSPESIIDNARRLVDFVEGAGATAAGGAALHHVKNSRDRP